MRLLAAIREAMAEGATAYAAIMGELAAGANELQVAIASAEAARVHPAQLPLAIGSSPIVAAPTPIPIWKPLRRSAASVFLSVAAILVASPSRLIRSRSVRPRAFGCVEAKALIVTAVGMTFLRIELQDVGV